VEVHAVADSTCSKSSRRALLGAAAGAAAATVVAAVTKPLPAEASTDHAVYTNNETAAAVLAAQSLHQSGYPNSGKGTALIGFSTSGTGVRAFSGSGTAVRADNGSGIGVLASSDSGDAIQATSTSGRAITAAGDSSDLPAIYVTNPVGATIWADSAGAHGLMASTIDAGSAGVHAQNDGAGWGVYGFTQGGSSRKPAKAAVLGYNKTG
jgi:hypothetical protein